MRLQQMIPFALLVAALLFYFGAADLLVRGLRLDMLVDVPAQDVIHDVAVRAAAAFAVSKTINAALSFVEEITVSGSFFVGASFNPASFLEPVNNLVDQFALVMLMVAASAALIGLLLTVGKAVGLSVVVPVALLLFALQRAGDAYGWKWMPKLHRLAMAAIVLAFVVRIALPLAVVLTGQISDRYFAEPFAEANSGLKLVEERAQEVASAVVVEGGSEEGFIGRISDGAADAGNAVKNAMSMVRESFDGLFSNVVTMITIFVLETVLLPLALVWLLYRIFRVLTGIGEPVR
jgi:hypothetical protein